MINIYKIEHNDKVIYVGQTIKPIKRRFSEHYWNAIRNRKKSKLTNKLKKYPKEEFKI